MLRIVICLSTFILNVVFSQNTAQASDFVLYDASAGTLPGDQPWLVYGALGGSSSQSLVSGGTRLSTDNPAQAGWSNTLPFVNTYKNPNFPTLDPNEGFAVDWSMQVVSESHISPNRAGTSILLLGADNRGIELGFWTDQIWAQSSDPLFTKAESANFDTSAFAVDYRLLIFDDVYRLYADDTQILTGPTRDYSAFGSAPYTLSNYFFLGDNTTSAGATSEIGSIRLVTAIPESRLTGILVAIVLLAAQGLKKRCSLSKV